MTVNRVLVVDQDGSYMNTILVDSEALDNYWPGYGHALIDLGPEAPEPERVKPPGKPDDFAVYSLKVSEPMAVGDTIDLKTGFVTKAEVIDLSPIDVGPVDILPVLGIR